MGEGSAEMTIPRNKIEVFLQTLKGYTEKWVAAKSGVQKQLKEANKVLNEFNEAKVQMEGSSKRIFNEMK